MPSPCLTESKIIRCNVRTSVKLASHPMQNIAKIVSIICALFVPVKFLFVMPRFLKYETLNYRRWHHHMLQISPKTGPIVCAIAYIHIAMSNILKTEAAQTRLFGVNLEHMGGWVTSEWPINIILIFKKPKQHKQNFLQHKRLRLFWRHFALGRGPTSRR